ncbi:unnamed protein product [Moneuplotes crassus]|uniref:Uncharacterized protein n=1 Tax=Euplotes crassus TaxID=5936 RepID=A0AAD1XML1_EUPCR|nr:unnamed protein product [Moneuplotes crassus]
MGCSGSKAKIPKSEYSRKKRVTKKAPSQAVNDGLGDDSDNSPVKHRRDSNHSEDVKQNKTEPPELLSSEDSQKKLIKLLKKYNIENDPILDKNFSLYLDFERDYDDVVGFVEEAQDCAFEHIRRLCLLGLYELGIKEMELLNQLILNSDLSSLKLLYMHGGSEMGTTKIEELLSPLFKITTTQVYMDSFKLTEKDMMIIFKNCIKVKELCLVNCNVSNLGEEFEIPTNLNFKMESLDLYWTCNQGDDDYLDSRKTEVLFETIMRSKLKNTLERVHICENEFDEMNLQEILDNCELDCEVIADEITPKPLK